MIRVTSQGLMNNGHANAVAHHYEIAKKRLVFQSAVENLKAYEIGPASTRFSDLLSSTAGHELLDARNAELGYQGMIPLNLQFAELRYWRKNEISQIDIDAQPVCQIDFVNDHIHLLNERPFDDDVNLEVVCGQALILLLSMTQIYCLHGAAVATPHGCFAMIAESGVGKSTLSAHVDHSWSQLGDGILPLEFIDDVELFHDFPQFRLDNACIIKRPRDPLFLKCILRLTEEPADQVEFKVLKRTDALLHVVQHTAAARLFDNELVKQHARFAKHVTAHIPTVEVSYPRDLSKVDNLRSAISEFIRTLE